MIEKETKAYIKHEKAYLVRTTVGDKWLNKEDFDFFETKNGMVIVEEKEA